MKIIHIIDNLKLGGTQKQLILLSEGLKEKGFSQMVICLGGYDEGILRVFANISVPVKVIRVSRIVGLLGLVDVFRLIKKEKPDILHTILFHSDIIGRISAKLAGVAHVISNIRSRNAYKKGFQVFLSRLSSSAVDEFVVNSANIVGYVKKHEMNCDRPVTVIRNGIKVDVSSARYDKRSYRELLFSRFGVKLEGLLTVSVGRLVYQKGYEFLIPAFALFLKKCPGSCLVIAGYGPDERKLRNLALNLNISDNVFFVCGHQNMDDVLKASDFLVSATLWEGMSNVIMEAMSFGLPVLATRIDGNLELIEADKGGLLVEPGNVEAMRAGLEAMVDKKGYWEVYGRHNREKIGRDFSQESMVENYCDLFKRIFSGDKYYQGGRFEFGRNWSDFSEKLTGEHFQKAMRCLGGKLPYIKDKSFLDIGCGSGIFSAAALALGAEKVTAFDYDPLSVKTTLDNVDKLCRLDSRIDPRKLRCFEGSILDDNLLREKFDIVYSWGVLHHSGDMLRAFNNAARMVNPGGLLYIAIYNRHFSSVLWKAVKYIYVSSPKAVKKMLVWMFFPVIYAAKFMVTGRDPVKQRHGMDFYHDVVDWVGGYPYEYASVDEVRGYFEALGFITVKVIPAEVPIGCNEFVFRKCIAD